MLKPSEPASADYSRRPFPTLPLTHEPRTTMLTNSSEKERWGRVKVRLRAEVGDDVYSSWFARMDLDAIEGEGVRLSVAAEHAGTNSNVLADETRVEPLSGNAILNGIPVELAPVRTAAPAPA